MSFELSFQRITAKATSDTVEALREMAQSTFAHTFRHYESEDLQAYLDESLSTEALSEELQDPRNSYYFVLHHGERAGYLKWIFPSEMYLEHAPIKVQRAFQIQRFYFLPEFMGRGLAPVALAFIEGVAKYQAGADYLYLSVWDRNYRAQSFYQKHGFRTIGSFDFPVGREIDHELLYGKSLAGDRGVRHVQVGVKVSDGV